jgi:hypothetical protein
VRGVCGVRRAEVVAGGPALRCEHAVTEAGGVARPGGVVWVGGELAATAGLLVGLWKRWREGEYFFGAARPIVTVVVEVG